MIQSRANGTVLFYNDANGVEHAHFYLEGKAFADLLEIRSAQIQAIQENAQAAALYTTTISNLQISVDAGRPIGAVPVKPMQKVVSDSGEVMFVLFTPLLPDLVIPPVTAPKPPQIVVPVADQIANQQAVMYNMILLMFRKMFPEA